MLQMKKCRAFCIEKLSALQMLRIKECNSRDETYEREEHTACLLNGVAEDRRATMTNTQRLNAI